MHQIQPPPFTLPWQLAALGLAQSAACWAGSFRRYPILAAVTLGPLVVGGALARRIRTLVQDRHLTGLHPLWHTAAVKSRITYQRSKSSDQLGPNIPEHQGNPV